MDLPKRKRIRLESYDYTSSGAYFLTICTRDRKMMFWRSDAVGAAISRPENAVPIPYCLSRYGELVDLAIQNIPKCYSDVSVDRYVIMPNHVHMLLQIGQRAADKVNLVEDQREGGLGHSRPYDREGQTAEGVSLERIVGQMKRWVSRQAGTSLWQKSFYEHVVRGDKDYLEIWNYIDGNPSNWEEDCAQLSRVSSAE